MIVRTNHLIRGRTVRQWAETLGLTIGRVYQLLYQGQLEARIDGTWKPKQPVGRPEHRHFGLSVSQWAKLLGVARATVRQWAANGNLERAYRGETIQNPHARYIGGMNISEWAEYLGVSRQRAHQLADKGVLQHRRPDDDRLELMREQWHPLWNRILAAWAPHKTAQQIAGEVGCIVQTVRNFCRRHKLALAKGKPGRPRNAAPAAKKCAPAAPITSM